MSEGQKLQRHHVQWAAQFAVASELCLRRCDVSFTMGNHTPIADLMVLAHNGETFLIDVKGQHRNNFWRIRPKVTRERLFYVLCVLRPKIAFYVMSQADVKAEWEAYRDSGVKWTEAMGGFNHGRVGRHKDAWGILPGVDNDHPPIA